MAIAVWGKCVGPSTVLVVLGIEVDSVNQIACLLIEKLSVLKELITLQLTWKWCNRQELESLIRHVHPAAKVVWPRRTYHAAWLTFYAAFKKEITQSILTGNFIWTSCGGTTFSSTGMGRLAFPKSGPRGGCLGQGCCLTGAQSPEAPTICPWATKISHKEPPWAPKTYDSYANFQRTNDKIPCLLCTCEIKR